MSFIEKRANGLVLLVYIQPGSKSSEIVGLHDGRLKIRINAPAVDGKANKELIRYLSKYLKIPKANIKILSSLVSRKKALLIEGLELQALEARIHP